MKRSRLVTTLVWLAVFGFAGMLYGVFGLISGNPSSWEGALPALGIFFLFGVWAGVVVISENLVFRRLLHSALLAALGHLAAQLLANLTFDQVAIVTLLCAVAGYFGEEWVKHV